MRRFNGLISGAAIGLVLGWVADRILTAAVLQYSDQAALIIATNALSAFLLLPLCVIVFGYLGYRGAGRRS